jgi:acetyl-CoA carboxylase biotin carboxyl carrier protein
MLINQIKKLIKLVEESEIDELEISRWGNRIRIRKNPMSTNSSSSPSGGQSVSHHATARAIDVAVEVPAVREEETADDKIVTSPNETVVTAPMVGTFYRAPSPEAPPFVEVGSRVSVGQTLCIIEAMKLMNELPSEINGVVSKIFVENGEPIEYGQELFIIAT